MKRIKAIGVLASLLTLSGQGVAQEADDSCNAPVDMVILSIVHDVERYQAYRASLFEFGTLDTYGGRVMSMGTRLEAEPEMLEGDWPDNRHAFVIRWPCEAAAKAFWHSETYQKQNLPHRVGAGQFNVALFPAVPDSE